MPTADRLWQTVLAFATFGLLVLVARQFHLESQTFFQVLLLAWVGFPIAALAPKHWSLAIFAVLSLASVGLVFGIGAGAWLVAIGAALMAICHLPIAFRWRVALVVAVALGLAATRVGLVPIDVPGGVWPILGAMFMFRLALYLYSIRHRDAPIGIAHAVGYFFMLPNVCFPLFPVVDYKTFAKGHRDGDLSAIHLIGLRWVARGMVQLLIYRYVYFNIVIDPAEVVTLGQLLRYVLATYFLYLRVSGQFHVIAGLLHLYGFRLPETHHLYYLASSFTDLWRRINIYWKDFMMKLVYYPSFFRLRKLGDRRAVVLATIPVFVVTWILHSYQWFWLRGEYPVTATDTLFWGILAVLVIVATLREMNPARRARARATGWQLERAAATLGTFVGIAVLWSLWSAESVASWLDLWKAAGNASGRDLAWLLGLAVGFGALAGWPWGLRSLTTAPAAPMPTAALIRSLGSQAAAAGLLLIVGAEWTLSRVPPGAADAIRTLGESRLNRQDAGLQQLGYYEHLDNINRFNTQLWQTRAPRDGGGAENLSGTAAHRARTDWLLQDLRPGAAVTFLGKKLTVNEWGMRDRPYTRSKPAGTLRVALLGPSDVLGWGVNDGETFEALAESALNQLDPAKPVEILNFAVHGYSVTQQLAMLRDRVWSFEPDVVIVVSHFQMERGVMGDYLAKISLKRIEVPEPAISSALAAAGITPAMTLEMRKRRLTVQVDTVLARTFQLLHQEIVSRGALPLVLGLHPRGPSIDTSGFVPAAAKAAGFPILDLSDTMQHLTDDEIVSADPNSGDSHPNARGHALLASRFLTGLASWNPALFGRGAQASVASPNDTKPKGVSP